MGLAGFTLADRLGAKSSPCTVPGCAAGTVLIDATGSGDPSWKDFTWDVIGAAVGLAIAWGIDTAVHGGKAPPLVATAGSSAATVAFDF